MKGMFGVFKVLLIYLKAENIKFKLKKNLIVTLVFGVVFLGIQTLMYYTNSEAILFSFPDVIKSVILLNLTTYTIMFYPLILFYFIADSISMEVENNYKSQLKIYGVESSNIILSKLMYIIAISYINLALIITLSFALILCLYLFESANIQFNIDSIKYLILFFTLFPILLSPLIYLFLNLSFFIARKNILISYLIPQGVYFVSLYFLISNNKFENYLFYSPINLIFTLLTKFKDNISIFESQNIKMILKFILIALGYNLLWFCVFNFKKVLDNRKYILKGN